MERPDANAHRGAGLISKMDGSTSIFSESSCVVQGRIAPTSLRPREMNSSHFAALLDRMADAELQCGRSISAERLSHLAADLREGLR